MSNLQNKVYRQKPECTNLKDKPASTEINI